MNRLSLFVWALKRVTCFPLAALWVFLLGMSLVLWFVGAVIEAWQVQFENWERAIDRRVNMPSLFKGGCK